MNDANNDWTNELMETEEELIAEMQVEFRKRLAARLQKKLKTREQNLPEAQRLKKKDRRTATEKLVWDDPSACHQRLLSQAPEVDRSHSECLAVSPVPTTHPDLAAAGMPHGR